MVYPQFYKYIIWYILKLIKILSMVDKTIGFYEFTVLLALKTDTMTSSMLIQ